MDLSGFDIIACLSGTRGVLRPWEPAKEAPAATYFFLLRYIASY